MTHNDLRKGDKVLLSGFRFATICDNRRGIRRCVKVVERGGWYPDMGDVYVWDIVSLLPPDIDMETVTEESATELGKPIDLSSAHFKHHKKYFGPPARDMFVEMAKMWNETYGRSHG